MLHSLFHKVVGFQSCNLIKKRLQHSCFPVKFAKILATSILKNICERLLLKFRILTYKIVELPVMFVFFLKSILFLHTVFYCSQNQRLSNMQKSQKLKVIKIQFF